MAKKSNRYDDRRAWYAIHTYAGYEEQVADQIRQRIEGVDEPKHDIDLQIGEVVNIIDGPFKGFEGSVSEIDPVKGKIKVMVSMFGRDTSVELDVLQVKKI